jgi:NADH dehydrogenase FAD-containing subunit
LKDRRAQVASAKDVIIIGAGPVGIGNPSLPQSNVELFGEIKMVNPKANVTIIQSGNLPLSPPYTDGFRQKAKEAVTERGGKWLLNEKVDLTSITEKSVTLHSGKTLTADYLVPTPTVEVDIVRHDRMHTPW